MYKELFDAIKTGTIEAVREAASNIFKTAVSVTDINFKVLSADHDPGSTEDMLESSNGHLYVSGELLTLFREHNLVSDLTSKPHETILVDWGYFADHPHITTGIFWKSQILGSVTVLIKDKKYTPEQDEALQACADALALVMHTNESGKRLLNDERERFISRLFGGSARKKDLDKAIDRKFFTKSGRYVVLASEYYPDSAWQDKLSYNTKHLYYHNKGRAYLLAPSESVELMNLQVKLESRGYSYGLSCIFHDVLLTGKMATQAMEALSYAAVSETKKAAWYFSEHIFDILIQKHLKEAYVIHPGIIEMEQYDAENNTEYLKTLSIWLDKKMDYSETAKVLHLHRNSLYYRMQRIKELFSLALDDMRICVYLYISLLAIKKV